MRGSSTRTTATCAGWLGKPRGAAGHGLPAPTEGHQIVIWADLHFDEDRIRLAAKPAVGRASKTMNAEFQAPLAQGDDAGNDDGVRGRPRRTAGRSRGGWEPPCTDLTGPWHAVLGNHDFTRFLWREKALGDRPHVDEPRKSPPTVATRMHVKSDMHRPPQRQGDFHHPRRAREAVETHVLSTCTTDAVRAPRLTRWRPTARQPS